MSKAEKALIRLQSKPKDFTWAEVTTILNRCGFTPLKTGGGSHKKFYNQDNDVLLSISRPHPRDILLEYQLNALIDALKETGHINE